MQINIRRTAMLLSFICFFFNLSAQSNAIRMVIINSASFDDTNGVTKLISTEKKLDAEFKVLKEELVVLQNKVKALQDELQKATSYAPAKMDEFEKMKRDYTLKAEGLQVKYQKRYVDLTQPVYSQIMVVMKAWAKEKGFNTIIDISKDDKGVFLWVEESDINYFTTDLIQRLNKVLL